jgi:hypothetical protein
VEKKCANSVFVVTFFLCRMNQSTRDGEQSAEKVKISFHIVFLVGASRHSTLVIFSFIIIN